MAYPTSPTNGQIYKNKKYNSTKLAWENIFSESILPVANGGTGNASNLAENIINPTTTYKHLGVWGVANNAIGTMLVNRAYRSDHCDGNSATVTTITKAQIESQIGVVTKTKTLSFYGTNGFITTDTFIEWLTAQGYISPSFQSWVLRGEWSYATNATLNDSGDASVPNIPLAGSVLKITGTASAFTLEVTTPTTGNLSNALTDWVYVFNGATYAPGWRRILNNKYIPTWNQNTTGTAYGKVESSLNVNSAQTANTATVVVSGGTSYAARGSNFTMEAMTVGQIIAGYAVSTCTMTLPASPNATYAVLHGSSFMYKSQGGTVSLTGGTGALPFLVIRQN